MWHHESVIAQFQIVLRLLIDLIALLLSPSGSGGLRPPRSWFCVVKLPSTKSEESSRGELTR
jgi:hypothetical protein